jgi:curli biogenesis system outer membrane secretion channel CsgG
MVGKYIIVGVLSLCILSGCSRYTTTADTSLQKQPRISKTNVAPSSRFLKRKVAVGRFTNETKYGKGFFSDESTPNLGKQAMDILSAKLTETDKFLLLERSDIDLINKELAMNNNQPLKIAADYLIIGSVSEFGRKETGEVGVFSRSKKQTAYAKVYIRLIDVSTGQAIYAEEGAGEAFSEAGTVLGVGAKAGYDATLNDKAISAAITKLVNNIIENLLDKPWRSYILSQENGAYIISGGKSQGIRVGDSFSVFERGKKVVNPQTNIPIELPGKKVASIKVESLAGTTPENEISFCSKTSGELPAADFSNYYIQEGQ